MGPQNELRTHAKFILMKKYSLIVLIFILCSSCKSAFMLFMGMHNPNKTPHMSTVKNYLVGKNMRTDNIVFPKDSASFAQTSNNLHFGLPYLVVYNKEGKRVVINDSSTCNNPKDKFTKLVCEGPPLGIDTTRDLSIELQNYVVVPLENRAIPYRLEETKPLLPNDTFDYTVFIFWAYWGGKTNTKYIEPWEKNLLAQDKCRVRVIKVCMDKTIEYENYMEH